MLLDNGTIKVSGHRDDYHRINVIEDCLAEIESDDEYASADEFFSSEEGANVIVPYFNYPPR